MLFEFQLKFNNNERNAVYKYIHTGYCSKNAILLKMINGVGYYFIKWTIKEMQ